MATLYDDISLGYHACGGSKVGKLYSFKPTDGSGDLTVTRAGTTAFTQTPDNYWKPAAANEPRFTYTGGVRGLLVEGAATRSNAFPFSIENAAWLADGITVDTNSGAGYDSVFVDANGINTKQGRKLVATANNGSVKLTTPVAVTAATSYVNSVYIKRLVGTGTIYLVDVNGTDRAVTVTSEWTRVQYAAAAAGTTGQVGIKMATEGDEVMVCYMPIGDGTVATSPIGGAEGATQTRNADVVSKTGVSALIGQTEGCFYIDFDLLGSNESTLISLQSLISRGIGLTYALTSNEILFRSRNDSGQIRTVIANNARGKRYKILVIYDYTGVNLGASGTNNGRIFVNGAEPIIINVLRPNAEFNEISYFNTIGGSSGPCGFVLYEQYLLKNTISDAEAKIRTTL